MEEIQTAREAFRCSMSILVLLYLSLQLLALPTEIPLPGLGWGVAAMHGCWPQGLPGQVSRTRRGRVCMCACQVPKALQGQGLGGGGSEVGWDPLRMQRGAWLRGQRTGTGAGAIEANRSRCDATAWRWTVYWAEW